MLSLDLKGEADRSELRGIDTVGPIQLILHDVFIVSHSKTRKG